VFFKKPHRQFRHGDVGLPFYRADQEVFERGKPSATGTTLPTGGQRTVFGNTLQQLHREAVADTKTTGRCPTGITRLDIGDDTRRKIR
jgi:hypothetical protein